MRLIIDTDAGVDDAQALMLALRHPDVTVEAITTVSGNVHLNKVVPNVLTVLDVMGAAVPVYRGAAQPLMPNGLHAEDVHGGDGLGDWPDRPAPSARQPEREHAVDALLRLTRQYPGELTIVALAPLTNLALAARIDPQFPLRVKEFIFMGGTIAGRGNATNPTAEFNILGDPEAAYITLESFPLATMLSWETTLYHPLSWEQYDALAAIPTPEGRFFKGISGRIVSMIRGISGRLGYLLPDPLAMAVALDRRLILEQERRPVTVALVGEHTRAQTVVDYRFRAQSTPNTDIVTRVDVDGFYQLLRRALGG
jgi:purine nucleosidase